MNADDFKKEIDNLVVGKQWSSYSGDTYGAIQKILDREHLWFDYNSRTGILLNQDKSEFTMVYNHGKRSLNQPIGVVSVHKKRGDKNGNYYGGSYDWIITGVDVRFFNGAATLEDAVVKAGMALTDVKDHQDDVHQSAVMLAQKLKSLGLSKSDAKEVIDELRADWWKITDNLKW